MTDVTKKRRNFLKTALAALATLGLVAVAKKLPPTDTSKKIKMLTPDGKLVEVDESVISIAGETQQRVSNKEIQDWMKTSKTN